MESDIQNFEIPQGTAVPTHPRSRRDKLLLIILPVLGSLILLTIFAYKFKPAPEPVKIEKPPLPEQPTPSPSPALSIASSSAFFSFVSSNEDLTEKINNTDLKELPYTVPDIDLNINFEQPN